MEREVAKISYTGIVLGAIALLLALFHFYAGPFSPEPALEEVVAEKAVAIRDATIAALKGEEYRKEVELSGRDLDEIAAIATALLGGIAVILGVVGFAMKEPARVAGGAAVLGAFAIAFQFFTVALGVIVLVILIVGVLSQLGIDI